MVTALKQPIVFQLEGFYVPPGYGAFFFFLALLNFILMLLANGVVLCVIVMDKNLHRPMFIMVCNLVVCDLLGATAVLPRLMMHFLMGQKRIAYIPAIAQAFSVHMYGVAAQTILGAMAYDRYIAVCEPLRYHAIMTSARLHSCCALAWFIAGLLITVLFILHMNTPLCGNTIQHVYCSNRAILNLACSPTPINNLYAIMVIVISHRFPSLSQNIKKFVSIMFIIIPPAINPIIYGLVSKELRNSIITHFIHLHVHQKQIRGV
ncbi:olfactory receptor 52E4-like [Cyclopterus lumpus]|uniref:olfactory receptor 52E4-like n=1 Tax=Cyclopterus lumpus TaxID=8103 RepID=UPI00148739F8|nr:olfactory receptor 52E4-like [Cyclopterus lumpus]